jgi:hypothetical protein
VPETQEIFYCRYPSAKIICSADKIVRNECQINVLFLLSFGSLILTRRMVGRSPSFSVLFNFTPTFLLKHLPFKINLVGCCSHNHTGFRSAECEEDR